MAVVFISPKQRQKVFFMAITAVVLLFLLIVSLGVFMAKPKQVAPALVFNRPKIDINMDVFSSDQFKNLQSFAEMEVQYAYTAMDEDNKTENGIISATSIEQARTILEGMDLTVIELKEAEIGRENPFTPYYQQITVPTPVKKAATKK